MSKALVAVVDEDLPRAIDSALANAGFEVKDVRDFGLRGKNDEEVMRFAMKCKAVLFSGDWGFANILEYPPKKHHGIVILHFPNECSTKLITEETIKAISKMNTREYRGNLIIVEPGKVRIRGKGMD